MMGDLKTIEWFAGLDDDSVQTIDKLTSSRQYSKNSVIMHEGDPANSMFLLVSGKVKVYLSDEEGREIILSTMRPGDSFGELALLGAEDTRTASVMTLESSSIKVLMKSDLEKLRKEHPIINEVLMTGLIDRVKCLTAQVKSLGLKSVYGRIRIFFNELADTDSGEITEKLTQQTIANHIGASREMVARILKDLRVGGYVSSDNKQITVLRRLPEKH